jgi:hypothetical protein
LEKPYPVKRELRKEPAFEKKISGPSLRDPPMI